MASPVNANWTIKFTAAAGNSGNLYDYTLDTSTNRYAASWLSAATPVHAALTSITAPAVHWCIRVQDMGYATPTGLYPYNKADKVVINGSAPDPTNINGRALFHARVLADLNLANRLATPIV